MNSLVVALFISLPSFADGANKIIFEKTQIQVGDKKITVQVADDDEKREHGLMFVKSMPENEGMLFVFDNERVLSFWMKNTLIPLSIGYFNESGTLVDVQEMEPAKSLMEMKLPSYRSKEAALFALEMNKNWFDKNHIKPSKPGQPGAKMKLVGATKSALLKEKLPRLSSGKL